MRSVLKKLLLVIFFIFGLAMPMAGFADTLGQNTQFYVNSKFDLYGRDRVTATVRHISSKAYFYIEDRHWNNLSTAEQNSAVNNITLLAQELDNNIYPKEVAFWGQEVIPGIDNDPKLTVLFEYMNRGTGGYFDSSNNYSTRVFPNSNQREMLTINADNLSGEVRKMSSILAHELQHLISSYRKDQLRSTTEETWLNELRSEYSLSLVGLNEPFERSSLQGRIREFLINPSDSMTEWLNSSNEYGAVALFAEYLTEQYGKNILKDSFNNSLVGINSINDYLNKKGFKESFSTIFADWALANYLNDTSINPRYGYSKSELKNIRIVPTQNNLFYPFGYTYNYSLKPWQPAWYRFNLNSYFPENKVIKLELQSDSGFGFTYVDNLNRIQRLSVERGSTEASRPNVRTGNSLYITNPEGGLSYFTLIPYNQSKTSGFSENDPAALISVSISFTDEIPRGAITIGSTSKIITDPTFLPDGALIRRIGENDLYVITGPYKRYMSPLAVSLYGHLDPAQAIEVDARTFDSFPVSNYVRLVGTSGIYAVWPDNTKHLFQVDFIRSGRDSKLIFTINPLEFNIYQAGAPITR